MSNYCSECQKHLTYPLERREKLCSTHLYLNGNYADKLMFTSKGYIIPKPEYLSLSAYYPLVWRFVVMSGTAIIGIISASE